MSDTDPSGTFDGLTVSCTCGWSEPQAGGEEVAIEQWGEHADATHPMKETRSGY